MPATEKQDAFGLEEVLSPTHTCFDDSLEFLDRLVKGEGIPALLGMVLVHGIFHAEDDGHPFAHAWVESTEGVITAQMYRGEKVYIVIPRANFYTAGRVVDTVRYTPYQAYEENYRSGHYGPWVERYKKLCVD